MPPVSISLVHPPVLSAVSGLSRGDLSVIANFAELAAAGKATSSGERREGG